MDIFKDKTILKKTVLILAVVIVAVFLGYFFGQKQPSSETKKIEELATPTFTAQLDHQFEFPIEESPEEDSRFKFIFKEAKKVKLITMQGEPFQAEAGEEFLIISFEIENKNNFPFEIDSQHYFRLQGEVDKNYAPDFYNGLVEVPADSTKKDELAFIIPSEQKNFRFLIGPITEKEREEIEISL